MPYKLEKDPNGKGYFVVSEDGKRHSDTPISRKDAVKQMRAMYANVPDAAKEISGFMVFKDAKNQDRWISYSSNSYRDLDGEIVSEKALANDVDRADQDRDYGPLRWWHLKGVDIGDCDFNMMNGRILIESGTFRTPQIAERVKEEAPNLQVSIGFKHPLTEPDSDGVYYTIKRFERSILPAGKAANPLTRFFVEGVNMATQKEKEEALKRLMGDPAAAQAILDNAAEVQKEANASGTAYKEVDPETAKAKKKPPVEDPADVEGSPAEEAGESQEEEDAETAAPGKKKKLPPFMKKELDDVDELKHADDETFAIGDVPIEEFYDTLSEVLGNILAPMAKEIATVKEAMEERTKAVGASSINQEARIAALEAQIATATKQIKELRAETPAVVRGYSATEDSRTVITDEAAKEKMPPQNGTGNGDVGDFIRSFALGL